MTEKTIKELAEELGVSKQRIQQIIAKLPTSKMPNKVGNKYVLNKKDIYNIKVLMGIERDNFSTSESANKIVDYDIYLDVLNSSKEKDEQLKLMQKLLDQQQQLTLQANQQIEKLQEQLQLTYTAETSENEESQNDTPPTNKKKWWQFW
ncbi:MarR family transcriptional regulator [Enterococcus faecalis]|uniref:MarR family transcriptional regulator n=1 Tax=Enterococcus faecalis TaxID=1351 RepID=UPI001A95ED12|nr:helix-turn-helix domain-containing protein [Enterococcus faecalis]MBO1135778.1 MarR family transcriptional regulator [Enterococcus faecalis]